MPKAETWKEQTPGSPEKVSTREDSPIDESRKPRQFSREPGLFLTER